jgi:hypothetical protein
LYSAINHILHAAVVTKMNNLGAAALHNATHDIDSSIVAIK